MWPQNVNLLVALKSFYCNRFAVISAFVCANQQKFTQCSNSVLFCASCNLCFLYLVSAQYSWNWNDALIPAWTLSPTKPFTDKSRKNWTDEWEWEWGKQAYLGLVHSDQALVDFGPGRNSADVPQLVGVFGKRTRLHLHNRERVRKTRWKRYASIL